MFPLFEPGTEITKKLSRYSGRAQDIPKSFPAIRDKDGKPQKLFLLFRNGNSRHSCWELYRSGNSRLCLILFHPVSSSLIFFHPICPLSSSFIPFHPLSSSFILFHPLSSSFILCYPLSSSFILYISLSCSFILFCPLSSVSLLLYFSCTHLCSCMFVRYESVRKQGCLKTMALPFRQRPW